MFAIFALWRTRSNFFIPYMHTKYQCNILSRSTMPLLVKQCDARLLLWKKTKVQRFLWVWRIKACVVRVSIMPYTSLNKLFDVETFTSHHFYCVIIALWGFRRGYSIINTHRCDEVFYIFFVLLLRNTDNQFCLA